MTRPAEPGWPGCGGIVGPAGLLDCAEVMAGWWLAGELQASPGQAVLLKAGPVGGGEHLEGEVAPSGGQGGPASVTMGIHRSGAQALGGGACR